METIVESELTEREKNALYQRKFRERANKDPSRKHHKADAARKRDSRANPDKKARELSRRRELKEEKKLRKSEKDVYNAGDSFRMNICDEWTLHFEQHDVTAESVAVAAIVQRPRRACRNRY